MKLLRLILIIWFSVYKRLWYSLFCIVPISCVYAQIDFEHAIIDIEIHPKLNKVEGSIRHYYKQGVNMSDSLFLHFEDGTIHTVFDKKNKLRFKQIDSGVIVFIKSSKKYTQSAKWIELEYESYPTKGMYFVGFDGSSNTNQVWTQGQGIDNRHWVPIWDLQDEKSTYDIRVSFPNTYKVAANGKLVSKTVKRKVTTWSYKINQPISSYLLAIAAGDYHIVKDSWRDIDLEYWMYPNKIDAIQSTYGNTQLYMQFMERYLGVDFPWGVYRQIPVKDFLHGGMENTTTTIFNDLYITDSLVAYNINYENINAHELAHHWFGDLVTAQNAHSHWIMEGMSTFLSWKTDSIVFGNDYFQNQKYIAAKSILSKEEDGGLKSLISKKGSYESYYLKSAFFFSFLEKKNTKLFRKLMREIVKEFSFSTLTTSQFERRVVQSGLLTQVEFDKWVVQKSYPSTLEEFVPELGYHHDVGDFYSSLSLINSLDINDTVVTSKKLAELIPRLNYPILLSHWLGKSISLKFGSEKRMSDLYKYYIESNRLDLANHLPFNPKIIGIDRINDWQYMLRHINHSMNSNLGYLAKKNLLISTKDRFIGESKYAIIHLYFSVLLGVEKESSIVELLDFTKEKYDIYTRLFAFEYALLLLPQNDFRIIESKKNADKYFHPHFQKELKRLFNPSSR